MLAQSVMMWAQSIFLLIIFLVLIVLAAAAILILLIVLKLRKLKSNERKGEQEARARRFSPEGEPLPAFGRGICHHCNQVSEKVFCLPIGMRLCESCYHVHE